MDAKDLIGKEIMELRCKLCSVNSNASIPLEKMKIEMMLTTGKLVSFPSHPKAKNIGLRKFSSKLKQVFLKNKLLIGFSKPSSVERCKQIPIVGLWSIEDDFASEFCSIEFDNGLFLTGGPISPVGVGGAELFLFPSVVHLENNYFNGPRKIY